jgi:hypothetical protein
MHAQHAVFLPRPVESQHLGDRDDVPALFAHCRTRGSDGGAAVSAQPQIDRDAALEAEIDAACERMIQSEGDDEAREHFREMARLVQQRSPHQIYKMELERQIAKRATFVPRDQR